MKIQNISNYMNYKGSSKPIKNEEEHIKSKNYDVVEIKAKSLKDDKNSSLNSIKHKIVSQINKDADAEKINKIKESINNNTYKIDIEEIVNKMLK